MKPTSLFVVAASVFIAALPATKPELVWETTGFSGPESVVCDQPNGVYYVSNMGTYGEGAQPGDGFITRMSLSGEILDLRWVSGFENPKGLAVANGRLYVGDDDGMVEIDLESATIVSRHVPPDGGSAGFNDCTADPDGNIYVFCSRLGAIFRLHGGEFSSWVEFDLSQTPGPNGLRAEAERLLLGGWSFRGADGESEVGHIATIRYADKAASRLGSSPVCHIDGLEPDGFGGYTVTDWATGDVLHVTAEGAATPIMKLNQGTADHEYLIEKGLLIIPLMKDDTVRAYAWAPQRRLR